jgi:cytochrome c peroxidase
MLRRLIIGAVVLCAGVNVSAETSVKVLAPGYGPLEFVPPAAGTYELPPLGAAVDGAVIDMSGEALRLHDVIGDKLVVMGFIYTHCPDVNGCPLASYVMKQLQMRLLETEDMKDRVRLISLSFDPILDTPEAMRDYSMHFRRKGYDWRFLTTKSEADLQPILDGYGQFRSMFYNEDGSYSGTMSHILRVYLVDRDRRMDTVLNDLRTLQMESEAPASD